MSTDVRGAGRIPVVLCVDIEPDLRDPVPTRAAWAGFPRTLGVLTKERDHLLRSGVGARFNWFVRLDPQVSALHGSPLWPIEEFRDEFAHVQQAGDSLGLHTHTWRWEQSIGRWVADYRSEAWIDECLEVSFTSFAGGIGRPCTTFRFGDRWMNHRTMQRLAQSGVQVDLTLEPGFDEASFYGAHEIALGALPDYRPVPMHPYRPSLQDYRRPALAGGVGLWELPVTTAAVTPSLPHRWYRRLITRAPSPPVTTALLSLSRSVFATLVHEALGREEPYLVLTLRSAAALSPRLAARIEANLALLRAHPQAWRFEWTTPHEAIRHLRPAEG